MHKNIWYILGAVLTVIIFTFLYYAFSPLWRTERKDERAPDTLFPRVSQEIRKELAADKNLQAEAVNPPSASVSVPKRSSVLGTPGHAASGFVRLAKEDGKTFLRYEDFKTINGPDLYVYLAKDLNAKEYINLGSLKATEGNVNYEVPPGVKIEDYAYALVWCQAFGVLFNHADLSLLGSDA